MNHILMNKPENYSFNAKCVFFSLIGMIIIFLIEIVKTAIS